MTIRLAVVLAGSAALAAPAAAGAAPVLNPLKPCYVSVGVDTSTGDAITEDVEISGSGFTPSSLVNVMVDGNTAATNVPIDAAGNLPAGKVKAPLQENGERQFSITVTEQENPAQTATATTMVTDLTVTASPKRARPHQRIRFRGRGFTTPDKPVWAHYVRGTRRPRVKRTVRLAARPSGPCGTFSVRRRQFPFKPKTGRWVLQVDQQRRWAASPATAFVKLEIFVKRVLRTRG